MPRSARKIAAACFWVALLAAADQLSKFWLTNSLAEGESRVLLPFLSLFHTRNSGIAFSMLSSFSDSGLIALTAAIIAFVSLLFWRLPAGRKTAQLGYMLILGGAIGNLTDRIRLHYVVDFILFHLGRFSFAIFNLADAFITCGVILLFLSEFFKLNLNKNTKA